MCEKLKKSQQVLIFFFMWLYFENVLFQLREQASLRTVIVPASGECWAVFSLAARRNPPQSVLNSSHSVQNFSAWFVLFLWSAVSSWETTLSCRSPQSLWAAPWLPRAATCPEIQDGRRSPFCFPTLIPLSPSRGPGHVQCPSLLCQQQMVCPWVSPRHREGLKHRILVFKVYILSM